MKIRQIEYFSALQGIRPLIGGARSSAYTAESRLCEVAFWNWNRSRRDSELAEFRRRLGRFLRRQRIRRIG